MKRLPKAQPTDKVEQAVLALQNYIINGELEPGTPLPSESEMVEQIGISKFSMREALRVAQSQGLVEISQGRRTRVADISIKSAANVMNLLMKRSKHLLLELTEARRSLEISLVRLAALRSSEEQIAEMERTIDEMEAHKDDIAFCVEKDIEFHEIMAQATQNRVFQLIHESISELLTESRQETLQISGVDKPIHEHRQIISAIKEGAPDKAIAAMNVHLDTAESDLKELKDELPNNS